MKHIYFTIKSFYFWSTCFSGSQAKMSFAGKHFPQELSNYYQQDQWYLKYNDMNTLLSRLTLFDVQLWNRRRLYHIALLLLFLLLVLILGLGLLRIIIISRNPTINNPPFSHLVIISVFFFWLLIFLFSLLVFYELVHILQLLFKKTKKIRT